MTIDQLAEETIRKHNLVNARTTESELAKAVLDLRAQVARGGTSAQQEYIASLQEQVARLTAELDGMRKLAADPMCIQKVKNELGPMSLWSKQGLEDHIRRETEKITAERDAFKRDVVELGDRVAQLIAERDALLKLVERASEWEYMEHEDQEVGARHCCGVLSYKPHESNCEFNAAIDAARKDKP